MWEDPIVAEVHRIRKEIAAKYNFDMAAYFADVQKRQKALGKRLVSAKNFAEQSDAVDRGPRKKSKSKRKSPRAVPGN